MDGVPGLEREEMLGVPAVSWGQMVVVYTQAWPRRGRKLAIWDICRRVSQELQMDFNLRGYKMFLVCTA